MDYLQREGCLLRAEHNILGEAFLVMASVAGYLLAYFWLNLIIQVLYIYI